MHDNDNDKNKQKPERNTENSEASDSGKSGAKPEESGTGFDTEVDFIPGETIPEAEKQARLAKLEAEIKQTAESMADETPEAVVGGITEEKSDAVDVEGAQIDEHDIDAAVAQAQADEVAHLKARRDAIREEENKTSDLSVADEEAGSEQLLCMNCKTPLNGPYCHECGQPVRHFIRFFPRVLWEMINEAFDLDSKIFRTLMPLFFRPGRLTMEYIAGRRARYVNPLRLYIITSIVFFISISVFTNWQEQIESEADDNQGVISKTNVSDDPPQATEATTEEEKEAVIRFNLQNEERQAAKRLENAKKALAELKAEKAEGAPIPDMVITRLENAIADGKIEDNELKLFNTDDGDMDVTFDDGSKWHPRDNPLTFDGTFDADTTEALNDFLWELKNKAKKANQDPSEFIEEVFNIIPQLMFLLLPLFALLLKVMYIFKKRYYMEHLIVALHSHCFIFLSGILILFSSYLMDEFSGNDLVNGILSWVILAIGLWVPINLFLQQKRIYAQGKIMTTLKFIIVGISYQFLMAITAAAAMVLGLVVI